MGANGDETLAGAEPIVREALRLASRAHEGQTRRDNERPFIEHPLAVARLLDEAEFDRELIAAALLHDAVEGTEMRVEDVAKAFGEGVAALVEALTEDDSIEEFVERKDAHRAAVASAGSRAASIYAADKLCNVRALRRLLAERGEAAQERFIAPLETRIRLWERDLEMLRRAAPELPFLDDLAAELEGVRADRARAAAPVHSS
jgi:(p)ppGpp synthase/HD superfamily hydrolase